VNPGGEGVGRNDKIARRLFLQHTGIIAERQRPFVRRQRAKMPRNQAKFGERVGQGLNPLFATYIKIIVACTKKPSTVARIPRSCHDMAPTGDHFHLQQNASPRVATALRLCKTY